MLSISTGHFADDIAGFERELRKFAKEEIPFASAFTLTQMGVAGKKAATDEIPKIFNNPTKFTQKAVFLTFAKKADFPNQSAVVWIKDASVHSLKHHITGGQRSAKTFEKRLRSRGILRGANQYAVPGIKAPRNKYGNMTTGQINKILSAVGAQMDSSANSGSGRNKDQNNYFVMQRANGHPGGIYKRVGGKSNPRLNAVLIFVRKVEYKRRWDFHATVEDSAYDAMPAAMDKAFDQAISKSFKK